MRRSILFAVVLALVSNTAASAAIIVSYSGGTVSAGGTGFVDVLISSDAASATPDLLDAFSAHFLIKPVGGAVSDGLRFVDSQSDSQLGIGSYVFFNNSLTPPPIGAVSTATNANDTFIGGDATLNAIPVALDNTQLPYLLFRLDLSAALANPADQFTIELVNDGSTQFLSDAFDPLSALPLDGSSHNPFTITAVPEPSTTAILLVGSACFAARCRRRRDTSDTTPQDS